jgi:hypothetical protein
MLLCVKLHRNYHYCFLNKYHVRKILLFISDRKNQKRNFCCISCINIFISLLSVLISSLKQKVAEIIPKTAHTSLKTLGIPLYISPFLKGDFHLKDFVCLSCFLILNFIFLIFFAPFGCRNRLYGKCHISSYFHSIYRVGTY